MNSFLSKVKVERKIINRVNSTTVGKNQLAGLSSGAIHNWALENTFSIESEVVKTLRVLSDLCNSLSDRSNESFAPVHLGRVEKINSEYSRLENELAKVEKKA